MSNYRTQDHADTGCHDIDPVTDDDFTSKINQVFPPRRDEYKEAPKKLGMKKDPSYFEFTDPNNFREMFEDSQKGENANDIFRIPTGSDNNFRANSNEFLSVRSPKIVKMDSRDQYDDIFNNSLSSAQ